MQTLEVTDEQYAFITHLREEISEQVVGKYGHVRECDAIQFLIDNFDDELDVDGEFDPGDPADIAVEEPVNDGEEVSYEEGGTAGDAAGSDSAGHADDGAASDDDMLDRMMNLLETHDDKWGESPSADHRYRVELPDGSTDDVQTKDDVRALLFKHY